MSFWDKIVAQNRIDSSYITELNDISYRSTNGVREKPRNLKEGIVDIGTLPFQVNLPQTQITKEMIMDYHKSQQQPLRDPITNLPINEKYYPSNYAYDVLTAQAPAPLKTDPTLGRPPTETDIDNYKDAIRRTIEVDIPNEKDLLQQNGVKLQGYKEQLKKLRGPTNRAPVIALKVQAENDIRANNVRITQLEQDINNYGLEIDNIKQIIDENKVIDNEHKKEIKINVNKYKESLVSNNARRLAVQQEPDEPDDVFLQRMKAIEQEQFDTNLYEEKAHLEQIKTMKTNLKKLIRSDEIIENVIKSFRDAQKIFIVNKHFAAIKEKFLETYGYDNKNLTTNDIVDILTNITDEIINPPTQFEIQTDTSTVPTGGEPVPVDYLKTKDASGADINTDFKFGTDTNSLFIENTANNNHVFFKVGEKERNIIFYSKNLNAQGSFTAVAQRDYGYSSKDTLKDILFDYLKLDTYAYDNIFKGSKKYNDIFKTLTDDYKLEPLKGIKARRLPSSSIVRYGWGINHPDEEIPTYGKFGKLLILLNKLFYKNILSLKYNSGHSIQGFNNTKVSDAFVEIIMELYKNNDVSNLIKNLNTDERTLLNSIIYMAGLNKKIITNTSETISGLKEKYQVIEGGILAGNDNPQLLEELKEVLLKLNHLGAISPSEIKKYLKQFN